MAKKPANLIYSVDEKPPLSTLLLLGLQHVSVLSVGWIFVVVIVTGIGGTSEQAKSVIQISMIVSGIATILQARTKGPVGSGYLCPMSCGPAYIAASISAGKVGGLPLVFGSVIVSGVFEALLSRVMQRLRALFPPEVTGLVVSMVGIELIVLAAPRFLGFTGPGSSRHLLPIAVALLTLAVMIGPTVWSEGMLRLYPVLLGLVVGYLSAYAVGLLTWPQLNVVLAAPLINLPTRAQSGWAFSLAMLPAFLIASLASTLKTVGDLTLCQKINDAEWKRTDMKSVSGGVLAGSICTIGAGLLGGAGQSTFSGNVGLAIATKATSRHVALPCGIILILLAFCPKLSAVFTVMPQPVMGAILVYVACFMILAGVQVMTSRMLDARKTFVVGISLIFGLSVRMVPGLYADVPDALSSLFSSSLSLATVLVIVLNLLFRIGIRTRVALQLDPRADSAEKIFTFMQVQGATWGARKEVIDRATYAMNEFMEAAGTLDLARGKIAAEVSFDEFNLDVNLRYDGVLMEFPQERPTQVDLLSDETGVAKLAGFLIRNYVDRIKSDCVDGRCRVQFHFDH
ncbi:MAG TPA: solute carrier family 23 protein [Candidatus Binatia bacterium]|nr:solute carrier family 23 protein [Candidatus Binatia bacterium]